MKLSEHVEHIRQLIDQAFRNRLGRMGINEGQLSAIENMPAERKRMETIREVFIAETGTVADAYEKLVEELTFTLFNRLAALKVMEGHTLHPEIVTRRESHGGRSFAHLAWLEQNPNARNEEAEGLLLFLEDQLQKLASDIPLFSPQHPYHLLPTALELQGIINAFNQVETDTQVETEIWKSDDVLGWLYESYNNYKKAAHKASGDKTEYNKVSIQSQVYTPRWVVQFLVDNSLGKLYLEMYPDSKIRNKYKIANAPTSQTRERKPLHEIRMIDPSTGSGNYLLYGFDMYYDLYIDQIENYGADYDEADMPELIIEHNLHGVDLDDRAIQLAQLGLYIKAKRKKRTAKIEHFNIVSSDFFLPAYDEVKDIFEDGNVGGRERKIIEDLWEDLQQAHKFGSLIRLEEKLNLKWFGTKDGTVTLFDQQELENYEAFRNTFFTNLQKAVAQNTAKQGQTFLNTKTQDAITFLQLLTQKYDVAVANPPYTDSGDFGPELKKFVETNYKKPYKFNTNLYAAFIKRCCEIATDDGYVGMIHPHTFMFIKTFQDVRKYMIEHTHIDIMVDYGLDRVNLFGTGILLDATWYVLSKKKKESSGLYFNITANQQEKAKQASLEQAYEDALNHRANSRLYTLPQKKLKIIEGWPFIYWISDGFREKFILSNVSDFANVAEGCNTANNERFLRYWWEIDMVQNKWIPFAKGGPFNKWQGNLWLNVNWEKEGFEIKNFKDENGRVRSRPQNEQYYKKEGITFTGAGSKGPSFRYLPSGSIFDTGARSIFLHSDISVFTILAFLNSNLLLYIADCLNPTVSTTVGDVKRFPLIRPSKIFEEKLSVLASDCVKIKENICSSHLIETNFVQSPLLAFQGASLKDRVLAYLNFENAQHTQVLINEAIINELIFEVYELSDADREQVEAKMGVSIGSLAVLKEAKEAFIAQLQNPIAEVTVHIQNLPITTFDEQRVREIKEAFATLYQSNNNLEEFCIRHQVNPINVWLWFKEANNLPAARASEIALEFLADAIRTLLQQDDDGIIPLVGLPGEEALSQRLEQHCLQNGFTAAQYMQLDSLLGRSVNDYLEHHLFNQLSNHLNLFMYLPKTPFIWHLSSGQHQGLEVYILIYKWNRDSLFKLKSQYISHRVQNLEYRQITLQDVNTAQAQAEKETIRLQLQEIKLFTTKIDELIAENYDPKLDDGVGKNIAPLQKKGLLRAEVLKTTGGAKSQLEKYLKASW
ncbi:BREX-1 system adenine-specific DNA-methyltransferase PglX [Cellulophaga baltica]|uniref:BREX-1 system adenine-specific DNA-methyltransferase PglX n=1 Tax=Cellulophaga baltica TaxID=76594 RepID=UPI000472B9E8|nr:BREX-1 system adenine-specific DNA-methyltransferase PglX [Cellulophaga baltica]AIY12094.1 restriction endonuclease Eco57I [Cellulophaga baltica NN016038]